MQNSDQPSPKDQMIAVLQNQPDDSSFDELMRELAMLRMTYRGLKDVDERRTVSNEEAWRRIQSWRR